MARAGWECDGVDQSPRALWECGGVAVTLCSRRDTGGAAVLGLPRAAVVRRVGRRGHLPSAWPGWPGVAANSGGSVE